jgi:D-ornithine 4,5-aminomutase subunit alpha
MNSKLSRGDDFDRRSQSLKQLSDEELKNRFWALANETVRPLVDLAKTHTTPSIERSVLMRMGFSSMEAKTLVDRIIEAGLIGKGAGGVVYKYHLLTGVSIREAGLKLLSGEGFNEVEAAFGVKR